MPRISTGLLICALVLSSSSLSAQIVNDLERASDSHSSSDCGSSSSGSSSSSSSDDNSSSSTWDYSSDSDNSDYSSSSSSSGTAYVFSPANLSLCGQCAISPFVGIVQAQKWMLSRRDKVNRIMSIEAQVPLALSTEGYFTFAPQVRGNWGLFSTGFRYFNLTEPALEGRKSWITYDLELLQLNLIQSKVLRLRLGTGLTIQDYQGLPFHETLAGLDFHFFDQKMVLTNEGRVSSDYCNCGPVHFQRLEYNASLRFRVAQSEHISVYNTYNYLYQNYYGAVNVWTAGAGLQMLLH